MPFSYLFIDTSIILLVATIIQFVGVITILFFERKDASTTIIWLIIITQFPLIGVILYLIFGRGFKIGVKRRLRDKIDLEKQYNSLTSRKKLHLESLVNNYNDMSATQNQDLIYMHYRMNGSSYTQDNEINIYTTGKDMFNALINDIKNSKESINVLYFIIKDDNTGNTLINLLTEKAKAGVKVKVIYDAIGSLRTPFKMFKQLKKAGGEVNRFFPLKLGTLLHANYRNHRKIVIIDSKIGYTGGMNIGDEYLGLHKTLNPWRDTHMRIQGSSVLSLQLRFYMDWYYVTNSKEDFLKNLSEKNFPITNGPGNVGMQIVSSGPDVPVEEIKLGIIKMINSAKKTIYIQTPYLIPDKPVLEALQIASASGVKVSVMLPSIPDKRLVFAVTFSFIQQMLDYGVKVYLYKGFLHSKMMVIDENLVTLGTTNFDIRSFSLHFEVNAFIYNEKTAMECSNIFKKDIENCELMTIEKYNSRSIFKKIIESIFRIFAPLM